MSPLEYTKDFTLTDLCRNVGHAAKKAGHTMADKGGEEMTARVKENTPVDTEHLRDSVRQKEVFYVNMGESGSSFWVSGAETFVEYGPHVEHGTGLWGPEHAKYKIEPKDPNGVLAFFARVETPEGKPILTGDNNLGEGQLVFARFVMHPGSPGQHMFSLGAAMVESEIDMIGYYGIQELQDATYATGAAV